MMHHQKSTSLLLALFSLSGAVIFLLFWVFWFTNEKLYTSKASLCEDFATKYLQTVRKTNPNISDDTWTMAIDVETELFNLCTLELRPEALKDYQPKALEKYAYQQPRDVPKRTSLKGEYVCLPHKNTDGPTTLECAFGLQTANGIYYALDFAVMSQMAPSDLQTGKVITVEGVLTPIENLSTNYWQKYNIKGIMSVTNIVKDEE